jgi:hypothetical protein
MDDRKLLTLAAKAAGIKAKWFTVKLWQKRKGFGDTRFFCGTKQVFGTHHAKPWSPLTDDGDALRLAVELQLVPYPPTDDYSRAGCHNNDASIDVYEDVDDCPYKATRRAIVRAAAAIGESMP